MEDLEHICADCGLHEDEHHEFRAVVVVRPPGCQCDSGSWSHIDNIPPACAGYEPSVDAGSYCATCEHDEACHPPKVTP